MIRLQAGGLLCDAVLLSADHRLCMKVVLCRVRGREVPDESSAPSQISYFKSSLDTQLLDMLWHKYWVNTLASSPLITTRDLATGQVTDICALLCEHYPFRSQMRFAAASSTS